MNKVIRIITKEIFQAFLTGYLLCLTIDSLKEGFVSNYFNLDILFWLVVTSGIINSFTGEEEKLDETFSKGNVLNWVFIICFSFLSGVFIWFKSKDLGEISLVLAFASSFIVLIFSSQAYLEEKKI